MKKINAWLEKFTLFWKAHDPDGVLSLFTDDVEYWETPFLRVFSFDDLRREWSKIKNQQAINLKYEVFSKEEDKYAVVWDLHYTDSNNQPKHYKGTYLLKLNAASKCNYFFHCGESRN